MFGRRRPETRSAHWSGTLSYLEMAGLIERFLDRAPLYGQEWNDFVDAPQHDWRMDAYRRCCYELDPLLNSPDTSDPTAISVLRSLVVSLREQARCAEAGRVNSSEALPAP